MMYLGSYYYTLIPPRYMIFGFRAEDSNTPISVHRKRLRHKIQHFPARVFPWASAVSFLSTLFTVLYLIDLCEPIITNEFPRVC
jgi:hypothetical protein